MGNLSRNLSRMEWQDAYYDGLIERDEMFCEESQTIHKNYMNDGWNTYEELEVENDYEDEYELRLLRGEIKRGR